MIEGRYIHLKELTESLLSLVEKILGVLSFTSGHLEQFLICKLSLAEGEDLSVELHAICCQILIQLLLEVMVGAFVGVIQVA